MQNKKVLFIKQHLTAYNIDLLNKISDKGIDVTAIHLGKVNLDKYANFKIERFSSFNILTLVFIKKNILKYCKQFDIVVTLLDLHIPQFLLYTPFHNKKFKVIYWTLGVSASYTKKYDVDKKFDFLRLFFYKISDAVIFYCQYPKNKYINLGINKEKLFVAENTVDVLHTKPIHELKKNLLFIGTLYKEKGIFELLSIYAKIHDKINNIPNLIIIGGGPFYNDLKLMIKDLNLTNKIFLIGEIYEEKILMTYFLSSIACISPKQAGLSVLKSMGYGVPFITQFNSFTGGEIFNIKNNINGILYKDDQELEKTLYDIANNKNRYIKMGENALIYYNECRTLEMMSNSMIDTFNYVNDFKIWKN